VADQLLVSVGRTAVTAGMGLEVVGIETDERGFIRTDDRLAVSGLFLIVGAAHRSWPPSVDNDECPPRRATGRGTPARMSTVSERPSFAALRSGPFRRLFAARTASQWGDTFNTVALVILVYRLSGSGLSVAATVVFEIVPVLLLGFVAGAVVDRLPRVAVMVAADLARAVIAGVLAVFGHHLYVVYAAAFAMSSLTVFFNPAASSVLPAVAGDEDLVGANSVIWSAAVVSQIALAPLAGVLVATAGAGPAFAINAVSFLVSALLLAGIRVPRTPAPPRRGRAGEIIDGLVYIKASRLSPPSVPSKASPPSPPVPPPPSSSCSPNATSISAPDVSVSYSPPSASEPASDRSSSAAPPTTSHAPSSSSAPTC